MEWARQACIDSIPLLRSFEYPDFEQDYELVALSHPDEYPMNEGRLVSNKGLDIADYGAHFNEFTGLDTSRHLNREAGAGL